MGLIFNKKNKQSIDNIKVIPNHIGIIMDGNGRWAKRRGLARKFGHNAGAKKFRVISQYCSDIGIKYLTVFAFSTENWRRPADEISYLMILFRQYLKEAISDFQKENIKINFLGNKSGFPKDIQELMENVENSSNNNSGMVLNIAMNYGGRAEIVNASRLIAQKILSGEIDISDINESYFSEFLYTSNQPDVDLVIRSSGEFRTSNFLIWQSAYAEYVVTDILWPDFETNDLDNILELYSKRSRRFGGV